jgi:hypothetical protein
MERFLDEVFLPNMREKKYETLKFIQAGGLKAPTLIIWGINDHLFKPKPAPLTQVQNYKPTAS